MNLKHSKRRKRSGTLLLPTPNPLKRSRTLITACTKTLSKKVEENPNTKREIKELITRLQRCTEVIFRVSIKDWLEKHKWTQIETPTYDVETETEPNERREMCTQTEENIIKYGGDMIFSLDGGGDTLREFQCIADKTWDTDINRSAQVITGKHLLTLEDEVVKTVWIEPEDVQMEGYFQKDFKEWFPELLHLSSDFEVIEQDTRVKSENTKIRQKIICIKRHRIEENLWQSLCQIRDKVDGENWVALHHLRGGYQQT